MQEALEETQHIKGDFLQILNFKNELEVLIEEQTQHIELKNKKLHVFEETLRFKDTELEKKDSLLRRMSGGADDMKKKLSQAEMKLRQITQTTLRDMKVKAKDQANEIDVLKEMVKSATKQAKAKDIDIQRLSQKIKRLEKFTDLNKGMLPLDSQSQYQGEGGGSSMMGIQEENENLETDGFSMPYPQQQPRRGGGVDLGLNPANYANIEDEVHAELLQAQQQRQFSIKPQNN
jgi:cysteinyl-tRNA synthetase